jgi:hypothetical protein
MKTSEMSLDEIRTTGMQVLARELGPVGLVRFIQMFERGEGDYSRERHDSLPARDAADIGKEIVKARRPRRRK